MDDENIKKNVVDEIYWDSRVDASDIKIEVNDREVVLEGSVPTYQDKLIVERDVWDAPGVKWVINNITVKKGIKDPSDSDIQKKICERMKWSHNLLEYNIEVTSKNGEVTLLGTVDKYWKKNLAESEAEGVFGVKGIHNKIAVVPTEKYTDKEIAKDIINALERRNNVNAENVDVKVKDGIVTLTGKVPNRIAFYSAVNAVNYTYGVKNVNNRLKLA